MREPEPSDLHWRDRGERSRRHPSRRDARNGLLNASDLRLGILDLENETTVALVAELDPDRLLRIVDIPEHHLAVGVKPPRRDYPGDVRASDPHPMKPLTCLLGGGRCARHVVDWDLETALQRPQPIGALHVNDEPLCCDFESCGHLYLAFSLMATARLATELDRRRPARVAGNRWWILRSGCAHSSHTRSLAIRFRAGRGGYPPRDLAGDLQDVQHPTVASVRGRPEHVRAAARDDGDPVGVAGLDCLLGNRPGPDPSVQPDPRHARQRAVLDNRCRRLRRRHHDDPVDVMRKLGDSRVAAVTLDLLGVRLTANTS